MKSAVVRTALFVPASRPERIPKALSSGADRVIVDLEDAVEEAAKERARCALDNFLAEHPQAEVLVRVNAPDHWAHEHDLALCQRHPSVTGIVLPKVETVQQIQLAALTGRPIWPIIESARGLVSLAQLAACEAVERLCLGCLDLGVDLGLRAGSEACERMLDQARYTVLLHSRAAGLAAALDGVFPDIRDVDGLRIHTQVVRDMGFGGALCIHPSQVEVIHTALRPSAEDVNWARRVVAGAASGAGAFQLEGRMIDAPVIANAHAILAWAQTGS